MRTLFMIIAMTLSIQTSAGTRLICATPHLTTTYVLTENSDHFELQVVHHNGVEFMPIHDGVVTPHDLKLLGEVAGVFKKTGERLSVTFKPSECTLSDGDWSCSRNEPLKLGELNVQNVFFKFSKRRVITRLIDYQSYYIYLSFTKDNVGYNAPMEYDPAFCTLN